MQELRSIIKRDAGDFYIAMPRHRPQPLRRRKPRQLQLFLTRLDTIPWSCQSLITEVGDVVALLCRDHLGSSSYGVAPRSAT